MRTYLMLIQFSVRVEVVRLVRVRAYTRWQMVTFDNSFESRNFADA